MKDFDKWNEIKKKVENQNRTSCDEGELWWCDVGLNIGSEQDGPGPVFERPVFVAKKFSNETCLIFPTTSQNKVGSYYYKLDDKSIAILCQPKLIDVKRLKRVIKKLSRAETRTIIDSFKSLL